MIVDMQNAYFENPRLAACRSRVTEQCNELIRLARQIGALVVNVRTEHLRDKSTWTLNMLDDDQGYLFRGSKQAACVDGLDIADSQPIVKRRDNAFLGTDLLRLLQSAKITELVVAGVSTHTCIAQTASEAYARNFRVVLAKDAVASHDPEYEAGMLSMLLAEYRQEALSTSVISERLLGCEPCHME
ncbi:cysteine hydrolase family protein [Spelaeicoccus albus]|uniref:cysteine hydrolase family protein n=1 Tax=Spelaeicoccus albus TaxID=1280376 RepID=UPI0027E0837A|nr:isochorismatase family cysteine hydrolase [Spelaeicoccus albus]